MLSPGDIFLVFEEFSLVFALEKDMLYYLNLYFSENDFISI